MIRTESFEGFSRFVDYIYFQSSQSSHSFVLHLGRGSTLSLSHFCVSMLVRADFCLMTTTRRTQFDHTSQYGLNRCELDSKETRVGNEESSNRNEQHYLLKPSWHDCGCGWNSQKHENRHEVTAHNRLTGQDRTRSRRGKAFFVCL